MAAPVTGGGRLLPTFHGYQRRWIIRDMVAGIATGAVVIPQAMAYASLAGLPVEVGLYTCMLPMLAYALLGGSRSLSITTTSTIAILTASTLAALPGDRTADELLSDACTLTTLVGICLLVMQVFRLGPIVEQVSPATMTGVRTGVGLTVAVGQLPTLLGVERDPQTEGVFGSVADLVTKLGAVNGATLAVSAGSITVLIVLRRHVPRAPGPLVIVAGSILLVVLTDIEGHGLALIPHVPEGLPEPTLPRWCELGALLPGAVAIAVMAFMETVIVARAQRQRSEPSIDSQQELLANGVAALAGGFSQSMPPAGGFSQSVVNQRAGARSQLAGVTTAALAVAVAVLFGPVLDDLPQAVLASLVLVAVLGLISPSEFRRLLQIDRAEFWVAVVTTASGLVAGLLLAVGVGVGLTLVLVLRELSKSQVRSLSIEPERPGVLALTLEGSLFTGNARATHDDVLARALSVEEPLTLVVVEASAIRRVTIPLLDTIEELESELRRDGVTLSLAALTPEVLRVARRSRWFVKFESAGHVHATVEAAIATS